MKGYNPINGTSPQQTLFIKRAISKIKSVISSLVSDVKMNNVSIVENNVANIPVAEVGHVGVSMPYPTYGTAIGSNFGLRIVKAENNEIDDRHNNHTYNDYHPIVLTNLDYAIASGLTTNSIVLTSDQKLAILTWLGINTQILPSYPAESGTFVLKYNNTGSVPSLSWVAEI